MNKDHKEKTRNASYKELQVYALLTPRIAPLEAVYNDAIFFPNKCKDDDVL